MVTARPGLREWIFEDTNRCRAVSVRADEGTSGG
jgi:hypothetical protein